MIELKDLTIGRVVKRYNPDGGESPWIFGHVVGFTYNSTKEVIPVIQFPKEFEFFGTPIYLTIPIHQKYIDLA